MEFLCQLLCLSLDIFDVVGFQSLGKLILSCVDIIFLFFGEGIFQLLDVLLGLVYQRLGSVPDLYLFFSLLVLLSILLGFLYLGVYLVLRQLRR